MFSDIPDDLPAINTGRWRYRTTAPVSYDTIAGKVTVPKGFSFYIGSRGIAFPPFCRGLARAALLHDYLYGAWYNRVAGIDHADTAMIAELRRHRTPIPIRIIVWLVIRVYGVIHRL